MLRLSAFGDDSKKKDLNKDMFFLIFKKQTIKESFILAIPMLPSREGITNVNWTQKRDGFADKFLAPYFLFDYFLSLKKERIGLY